MSLAACSEDGGVTTPTSASTTTSTTVAEASTTEEFVDSLPVGGSAFYSFSVAQFGTVNITLNAVGGPFVPSTAWVGLGIGQPSGTDCTTTATVNVPPGAGPHLTGTYDAGVYCARVWDIGNLFGPARFQISIAHP